MKCCLDEDMSVPNARYVTNTPFTIQCDCINRRLWDDYVKNHKAASNYHRYGWRDVVETSFNHPCFYLAAREHDGSIIGVLPLVFLKSRLFGRFLVSQPFFNYGGLLYDYPEIGEALLAKADELREELGAEHVELRHTEPLSTDLPTKQHKVSMILELADDEDAQWKGFDVKLRNQIRKAEKSGLTAVVGGSELLTDFYAVFARNMRDLGTPVYPVKFFSEILKAFPGYTRIISVYLQQKPVSAGLISCFRDTVEIPWASSIRTYNKLCPNNLLYWTALQYALRHRFTQFDFGRSTQGEGTYRFKEQWGARPIKLNWQYLLPEGLPLPELNTKNPKYELAIKVWKKLPLPLTKFLGPHIVKNIP